MTGKQTQDKAKELILALVHGAPSHVFEGKVRLFKAYYFAHLYFARATGRPLCAWSIVKMPQGPGIDDFDSLLSGLTEEGRLSAGQCLVGPYASHSYEAAENGSLSDAEHEAVRKALAFIEGKTAAELSELTHRRSRSWQRADDGDVLNIYEDLLSEDAYAERQGLVERCAEQDIKEQREHAALDLFADSIPLEQLLAE